MTERVLDQIKEETHEGQQPGSEFNIKSVVGVRGFGLMSSYFVQVSVHSKTYDF